MDNFLKNQLYRWTYEKIKSNPKKFGGDSCNALLMQKYIQEVYNIFLPLEAFVTITTVSRIKSDLLLENPHFDFRVKHKSKKRKLLNGVEK